MGRLIDADRLKAHYCWWAGGSKEMSIDEAKRTFDVIIDVQPTVDAVEVVRCKDCKWRGNLGCAVRIVDESDNPKDDDFCSWGERKEDD